MPVLKVTFLLLSIFRVYQHCVERTSPWSYCIGHVTDQIERNADTLSYLAICSKTGLEEDIKRESEINGYRGEIKMMGKEIQVER